MTLTSRTWDQVLTKQPVAADGEAVRALTGFFGLSPTGKIASAVTGLSPASIHDLLSGKTKKSSRHAHLQVLKQVVDSVAEWRRRNGDVDQLGEAWLMNTTLDTSAGERAAVDVLSDPVLAREALAQIRGALSA